MIKDKTLPKAEVILRDIKQVVDETPVKTYKRRYSRSKEIDIEYSDRVDKGKIKMTRTVYTILKRNISNARPKASKKAQDAGLIGANKIATAMVWQGITTDADLQELLQKLRSVLGVDKAVISLSEGRFVCPLCENSVNTKHEPNGQSCTRKQDFLRSYRSRRRGSGFHGY